MKLLCEVCDNTFSELDLLDNIPRSSAHLYTTPSNDYETARFIAAYCNHCGYIKNKFVDNRTEIYEKSDYQLKTAVSSSMSFNLKLIRDWILGSIESDLKKIRILEVGSGSGELAHWFSEQDADVYTIDLNIKEYENKKIKHIQGQLDAEYINSHHPFDLIIARHLLEHVDNPQELLSLMSQSLTVNGKIYIEVPNAETTLRNHRIADYFNDHIHHFIPDNIRVLSEKVGLNCKDTLSLLNGNHKGYLLEIEKDIIQRPAKTINFSVAEYLEQSKNKLTDLLNELEKYPYIFIYGAGAHSATIASQLNDNLKDKVLHVWDKDPNKTGKFLPGISVPISKFNSADKLPDTGVILNTGVLYKEEIEKYFQQELGLKNPILNL